MNRKEIAHQLETLNFVDLAYKIETLSINTLKQVDRYLSTHSRSVADFTDEEFQRYQQAWNVCKHSNMIEE